MKDFLMGAPQNIKPSANRPMHLTQVEKFSTVSMLLFKASKLNNSTRHPILGPIVSRVMAVSLVAFAAIADIAIHLALAVGKGVSVLPALPFRGFVKNFPRDLHISSPLTHLVQVIRSISYLVIFLPVLAFVDPTRAHRLTQDMEKVETKLNFLKNKTALLESEKKVEQGKVDSQAKKIEELEGNIKELKKDSGLDELEKKLEESKQSLSTIITEYQKQIQELQNQNKVQSDSSLKQIAQKEKQITDLQDNLQAMIKKERPDLAEIGEMKEMLEKIKELEKDKEGLKVEVKERNFAFEEVNSLSVKLKGLGEKFKIQYDKLNETESENEKLRVQIRELEEKIKTEAKIASAAEKKVDQDAKKIEDLHHLIETSTSDLDDLKKAAEQEIRTIVDPMTSIPAPLTKSLLSSPNSAPPASPIDAPISSLDSGGIFSPAGSMLSLADSGIPAEPISLMASGLFGTESQILRASLPEPLQKLDESFAKFDSSLVDLENGSLIDSSEEDKPYDEEKFRVKVEEGQKAIHVLTEGTTVQPRQAEIKKFERKIEFLLEKSLHKKLSPLRREVEELIDVVVASIEKKSLEDIKNFDFNDLSNSISNDNFDNLHRRLLELNAFLNILTEHLTKASHKAQKGNVNPRFQSLNLKLQLKDFKIDESSKNLKFNDKVIDATFLASFLEKINPGKKLDLESLLGKLGEWKQKIEAEGKGYLREQDAEAKVAAKKLKNEEEYAMIKTTVEKINTILSPLYEIIIGRANLQQELAALGTVKQKTEFNFLVKTRAEYVQQLINDKKSKDETDAVPNFADIKGFFEMYNEEVERIYNTKGEFRATPTYHFFKYMLKQINNRYFPD